MISITGFRDNLMKRELSSSGRRERCTIFRGKWTSSKPSTMNRCETFKPTKNVKLKAAARAFSENKS